jgi:hypothetical protein
MQPLKVPSAISAESIGILYALLPGVVTFLVARALTERAKKIEATEAVLYSLAYTLLVHALWASVVSLMPAAEASVSIALPVIGVTLGVLLASMTNTGCVYALLRWLRVTREASAPSTWLAAFEEARREGIEFAVLHLNDGRRLYGNVRSVSNDPADGHVLLGDHRWLNEKSPDDAALQGGYVLAKQENILLVELVSFVTEESRD